MMDPTFRDSLMTALRGAVANLNAGDEPDEAVAKSASANAFNLEQTKRLCETFNTARTLYHFETHPNEKEASFPLADQANVLRLVFSAGMPAAKTAGPLDICEYAGTEKAARDGRLTEALPEELFPKQALREEDLPSLDMQGQRVRVIVDSMRNLSKQAQSEASQAQIVIGQHLTKLAGEVTADFDTYGHDRYARLWAQLSAEPNMLPMLRKLAEFLPARVDILRSQLDALPPAFESRDLREWAGTLRSVQKLAEHASNTTAAAIQMLKEANAFENAFLAKVAPPPFEPGSALDGLLRGPGAVKEAQTKINYKVPTYRVSDLLGPDPVDDDARRRQEALSTRDVSKTLSPGLAGALAEGGRKGLGDAASGYIQSGMESILGAGEQERTNRKISERLRNQQREVLLNDLMLNDPFISGGDPQAVAAAYQTMMVAAPELSTQREVVRAFLRQAVQSVAVGPYEVGGLADAEKTVREIAGTLPARPGSAAAEGGKKK